MKKLNYRSKVMVYGFLLGLLAANLVFQLSVRKNIGIVGLWLVIGVMVVIFVFGFLVGKGVRIAVIYGKAWEDGYREGKIDGALNFGVSDRHPNCRCAIKPIKQTEL